MPKRKVEDRIKEYDAFNANILEFARKGGDVVNEILRFQNDQETNHDVQTMTAKEFSLDGAVAAFGLQYSDAISFSKPRAWKVEEIPETKGFKSGPCLKSLIENYSMNFSRTSEAACRIAVDFILNECLTVMKRYTLPSSTSHPPHAKLDDQTTDECSMCTFLDIKVFGEVSFTHRITATKGQLSSYSGVTVNGCVDHAIGRTISPSKSGKRRFQSLLLLVDAKTVGSIEAAFCQLVVYLGSLHQSRLSRNRSNASVYGVASDGYQFTFITITHEGVLKKSKQFDITKSLDDLETVLGCLKYLLEKSASMTPNLTNGVHPMGVDGGDDPAMQPDDNVFIIDDDCD